MYNNANLVWLDSWDIILRFFFTLKQNLRLAIKINIFVLSTYFIDITLIED